MRSQLTEADLRYVCRNLRPESVAELRAAGAPTDAEELADSLIKLIGANAYCFSQNGTPAYAGGAVDMGDGQWVMWGISTSSFGKIVSELTRFVRRVMIPSLFEHGAAQLLSFAHAGNDKVHGWLKLLGGEPKDNMNGFTIFVWSKV